VIPRHPASRMHVVVAAFGLVSLSPADTADIAASAFSNRSSRLKQKPDGV
jgi:hypothetical protein